MNKAQKAKDIAIDWLMEAIKKVDDGNERENTLDCRIRYVASLDVNPMVANQYMKLMYGILLSAFLPAVFALLLK